MRNNMDESDVESFDKFVEKHWGNKLNAQENEKETAKRRGRPAKEK